jgi:hypothetical protein
MSRTKRTSRTLEKIELRAAGWRAIDPNLDFGDGRNLQQIATITQQLRLKLDAYNTALTVIDSSQKQIQAYEKTLNELAEKMLIGVAFRYGKDSQEYEMAGGVRKSDRIRRSTASRLKANSAQAAGTTAQGNALPMP